MDNPGTRYRDPVTQTTEPAPAAPPPTRIDRIRARWRRFIDRMRARYDRFMDGFEHLIERWEAEGATVDHKPIVTAGNRRMAFIGIGGALVGTIAALVVAYTIGGVQLVKRLGYVGVFLSSVIGSASMFIPVPGSLAGITFGLFLTPIPHVPQPLTVAVVVAAGSAVGELTGYSTGIGGRAVIGNSRIGRLLVALMQRHGSITVFLIAAVPNPFIDVGGIAAGVAGMPIRRFMAMMFCGKTLNYLAIAYIVSSGIEWAQKFINA